MSIDLAKQFKRLAVGGAVALASVSAFAATDGATGFNSTGDLDINLTVNDEVKISNLDDINLSFSGSDVSDVSLACVYRNGGTGDYLVTATGDGGVSGTDFELTDGTNSVAYSVIIDDGEPGNDTATLASGTSVARTNASSNDDDCFSTADNVLITVGVAAADANSLPAATYSGVLTLLVAPN